MKNYLVIFLLTCLTTVVAAQESLSKSSERGPVAATVSLSPAQPRIGDVLTLSIEVVAEADVEVLMPEFGQALSRFTILDYLPKERLTDAGQTVFNQRYTLQAPLSGEQYIPQIMVEFVDRRAGQRLAPEGEDAYELLTERLNFQVESVAPATAGDDLKPLLGELAPRQLSGEQQNYWRILLPVVIIILLPLLWRWWQKWRHRVRQRSAFDIAYSRLQKLRTQPPDSTTMKPFFMELSDIVRRYLENRFGLHAPELTTEEFLDVAAASPDLTQNHQGFLRSFLQTADQVKFARHIPESSIVSEALDAATNFLQQTQANEGEVARA